MVNEAKRIPRKVINKFPILRGSSSSLSNSIETVKRELEDLSLKLLFSNCFGTVFLKSLLV